MPRRPILLALRGLDPVGTGRQVELLAAGFIRAGHDVHVAVLTRRGRRRTSLLADRLGAAGARHPRLRGLDRGARDRDRRARPAGGFVGDLAALDRQDRLGALHGLAEGAVLAVEARGLLARQRHEPLAARAVGPVVARHGQDAEVVRQAGRLEHDVVPGAAVAGAGRVAALDHERLPAAAPRHHAVDDGAVVEAARGELGEVPRGRRGHVGPEREADAAGAGL